MLDAIRHGVGCLIGLAGVTYLLVAAWRSRKHRRALVELVKGFDSAAPKDRVLLYRHMQDQNTPRGLKALPIKRLRS